MPDKHEVGGSSPLGPTTKPKGFAKVKIRREPRAFLERAVSRKGRLQLVEGAGSKVGA